MVLSVVTGKIITDNTGTSTEMPVLLSTAGPIRTLIDYCLSKNRSLSWQEKLLRATRLFLEYLQANSIKGEEEWRLFRNFSKALREGTFDPHTHLDSSGLCWQAMDVGEANYMIRQLSDLFEWLGRDTAPGAASYNPLYSGNSHDQRIDQLSYMYRRSKAFLGHSWSVTAPENQARLIRGGRTPKVFPKRSPMFPEARFEELLFNGFKVAGKHDYRGMLITLLLFGGGLRVSEPFHLFTADVQPHWDEPNCAFVTVHHPSLGSAPNHWKNRAGQRGSRQEYLADRFGLVPRHHIRGKLHAGWKNPALDDKWYMHVHWFPEIYGQWFMQIWMRYLEQITSVERSHPYAWINIDGGSRGGIYTISQYQKALKKAVEKIGLIFGKSYGTTAHGSRHAYGQRARRAGISEIIIQRLMHHCSPESQSVYTQPEAHEARNALRRAAQTLRESETPFESHASATNQLSF